MMVKVEDFIKEEINDAVRCRIFQGILENKYGVRERLDLVFNRYSIEINFQTSTVTIFDDVFSEDKPKVLDIKSLFTLIKK